MGSCLPQASVQQPLVNWSLLANNWPLVQEADLTEQRPALAPWPGVPNANPSWCWGHHFCKGEPGNQACNSLIVYVTSTHHLFPKHFAFCQRAHVLRVGHERNEGTVWSGGEITWYSCSLPSMPSSGASTIRTRASGRRTTGTMTMEDTRAAHRGAQAHSSRCWSLQRPMPAASTSTCLGPSTPLSPVVLRTQLSQGLPPSSPLLPEGLSFQTGTVIFSFIFVPSTFSSSCLFDYRSLLSFDYPARLQ